MTPHPPASETRSAWLASAPALFVGLVLVATGTGKGLDIAGFTAVVAAYDLMPEWGDQFVAHALPPFEFATGIALFVRRTRLFGAMAATALHALLVCVVTVTLLRGIPIENCGCFGVFFARPLGIGTFFEDIVMLGASVLAWRWASSP